MLPKQIAIIWQAQFLTLSASNALLKILEEPVVQSLIFLITENYQQLLITIQSRCEIIIASNNQQPITNNIVDVDLKSLYQAEKGERMGMMATACTNQQEALAWLQSLMYTARSKLAKSSPKGMRSLAILLENAQTIYNDIGIYNVNWKLALDMLGLWWDKKFN